MIGNDQTIIIDQTTRNAQIGDNNQLSSRNQTVGYLWMAAGVVNSLVVRRCLGNSIFTNDRPQRRFKSKTI
jgi:hypothetical protein